MKIHVGLIADSYGWAQILKQEGVSHGRVELNMDALRDDCSVLVINRPLGAGEREAVEQYLRSGGAVIGYAAHCEQVAGTTSIPQHLDYILSHDDERFPDVSLLDLGMSGAIPREAHDLRTQSGSHAMFAGELGGGVAVLLPFDVDAVLRDTRAANKCFYFTRDRLPAETVSLCNKGEARHLVRRCLEYLHAQRGLPYIHLWYFPDGQRNLFAFRIDTDGAPEADVDALYETAVDYGVSMSWYLDVKSHEPWLRRFGAMVNQEIGVHCYEHRVFDDPDANRRNISRALHLLESAGIRPEGFAAPFGEWNSGLGRVLQNLGFEYSSEFGCAYDTLPFHPQANGDEFETLQIPVHPISIGSMRRVGYDGEQMAAYYRMVMDMKLARNEPLFFYHHPTHHHWDVVRTLFSDSQMKGVNDITLGGYARWWKKRLHSRPIFDFREDRVMIQNVDEVPANQGGSLWLRVRKPSGEESLVNPGREIALLHDLDWKKPEIAAVPGDLSRIREFDPRTLLGNVYSTVLRKMK